MPSLFSRPSSELFDYEKFLTVLREELDRAMEPLSDDLKEVSTDLKTMQANTYNREMMDAKLQVIRDELKKHEEDLKTIHRYIGNWQGTARTSGHSHQHRLLPHSPRSPLHERTRVLSQTFPAPVTLLADTVHFKEFYGGYTGTCGETALTAALICAEKLGPGSGDPRRCGRADALGHL